MFEELAKILPPPYLLIVAIFGVCAYAVMRGVLDRKKPEMQVFSNGGNPGGLGIPSWLIVGPMQEAFSEFYKACENQRNIKDMTERSQAGIAKYQEENIKLQKRICEIFEGNFRILEQIRDDTKKFSYAMELHTRLLEDIRNDMLVRPGTPRAPRKREGAD